MIRATLVFSLLWLALSSPVPAAIIDLTTANASGGATAAIGQSFKVYQGNDGGPAGTGVSNSFVRIQMSGAEQGYNTSYRPVQYNELTDPNFTRQLHMSEVPLITILGVQYREFRLDINEKANQENTKKSGPQEGMHLSLNQIQIFTGPRDPLSPVKLTQATSTTPSIIDFGSDYKEVFRMNNDSSPFTQIQLTTKIGPTYTAGSGRSDMYLYVRNDQFGAGDLNVILYSQFGNPPGQYPSDAGFEEWSVRHGGGPINPPTPGPKPVPEPGTLAIWGLGLGIAGLITLGRGKSGGKALTVNNLDSRSPRGPAVGM